MVKVVTIVPKEQFDQFDVHFPKDWETVYLETPCDDRTLIENLQGADFLLSGPMDPVTREVLTASPSLKLVHVQGVGYDKIDYRAAAELGLAVCNNKAVNAISVAEHTVGFMLSLLRDFAGTDREIKAGGYAESQLGHRTAGVYELSTRQIGLIGLGYIGCEVARLLKPFGCAVNYYDLIKPEPPLEAELGVNFMPFEEMLKSCHIISAHVPVLPDTIDLINRAELALMRPGTFLINTARGEIVNAEALAEALESGHLGGAAADVISPEPPHAAHPLLNLSPKAAGKLILTPHLAGTTVEAYTRMLDWAIANMKRVLNGQPPINIINGLTDARRV